MMKIKVAFVLTVSLLVTTAAVQAATYTIDVPLFADSYAWKTGRTFSVDFGRRFTSIQGLTINWAGRNAGGEVLWGSGHQYTDGWSDYFKATMIDSGVSRKEAQSSNGYPRFTGWDFSESKTFTAIGGNTSWSFLHDGQATMNIFFGFTDYPTTYGAPDPNDPSAPIFYDPYAWLDSVSLTLEGTAEAVPEPSGLLALFCGLGGSAGCAFRRRNL